MEEIDWSKAPEGAEYWCEMQFFKTVNGEWKVWCPGLYSWVNTAYGAPDNASWWGNAVALPATQSWSGEGLPPVGVDIELLHELYGWIGARVVGQDGEAAIVRTNDGYAGVFPHQMRPIRTPEQIAADERETQVVAIHDAIVTSVKVTLGQCDSWRKVAEMVYDAGFKRG